MAARRRLGAIIAAVALFAVMLGVGLAAVTSSGYRSVCSLRSIKSVDKVVVGGEVRDLGVQRLIVHVGPAVFETSGVSYSPTYAVVKRVSGSFGRLDTDDKYAMFIIGDPDCNNVVVALYSAKTFTARYGMHAVFERKVVVEGYYNPNLVATIMDENGRVLYRGPVLVVTQILKGCHEAYSQGTAVVTQ